MSSKLDELKKKPHVFLDMGVDRAGLLFTRRLEKIALTSTNTENGMQEDHTKYFKEIEVRIEQLRGFL